MPKRSGLIRVSVPSVLYKQAEDVLDAVVRAAVPRGRRTPDLLPGVVFLEGLANLIRYPNRPRLGEAKSAAKMYAHMMRKGGPWNPRKGGPWNP
jgi:hypothetical protein